MSDLDLDGRLDAAARVARRAGALALDFFNRRDALTVERKGMQDLVSIADRSVEDLIRAELGGAFPSDAFVGEEGGGADAPRVWVIDPIDGTTNFLRGVPCWGVCIAYVVDGVTELGITYDPVHDELFTARRGHGAFKNGHRIAVSGCTDPQESLIGLTYSFKMDVDPYTSLVDGLIRGGSDHRRSGSTAIKLCWVADSRTDGLVTLLCASWDCLAGLVLVREAGGLASDFVALHGLLGKGGVLACTPGLADYLSKVSGLPRPS